ncbi:peptide ABC transporter ATP-binding protein [Bordetella genomosp. 10]|uniref:Peptide ABC transporter ATP-binding protein n=1 Tax=Bordetella genomosp. 10 TaxID=1416804 RepID=A0A261SJ01_9BORD|nr:ABC transporter ATP-binding protein [Bordetella genomosp. 10]OZI37135.1 peptide ABC transporter ATP-binding protein [Bordetella genomosp. 10]
MNSPKLLQVDSLRVTFPGRPAPITVVDDVTFSVAAGETLAIVGESGCGKSMTALALTRLLPPRARVQGLIRFQDRELLALPDKDMRALRGSRLATIFQDPMAALNPVMTVGAQIAEAVRAHEKMNARTAWARAHALLDLVHIPQAARRLHDYPHRLSGGMRQRVAIAMALACRPALLIADEPTTALDVTIQAQIMALLTQLQRELGMALILITHDLGVVAETADRVIVMYAGRVVEQQSVQALFRAPAHPYTRLLVQARPQFDSGYMGTRRRLLEIPGAVPAPGTLDAGCAFVSRCDIAAASCHAAVPALRSLGTAGTGSAREVACHRAEEEASLQREIVG